MRSKKTQPRRHWSNIVAGYHGAKLKRLESAQEPPLRISILTSTMTESSQNQATPILKVGDELLLPIIELLCVPDVLSCSLVNSRLHSVAEAAMIPFRNALQRYGLVYHPYNSPSQSNPDQSLFELLESIRTLNRNWLHLKPVSSLDMRILNATDDTFFLHDYAVVDRIDPSDSEDDEPEQSGWEIEAFKYGGNSASQMMASGEGVIEIEDDGTIVEEIDAETHGIDVNAIETDDEEEEGPDNTDIESNDSDDAELVLLETEGLQSVGLFRTTNSFMTAYRIDPAQDLIITAEQWLRSKVKKSSRKPAGRGGLNFSRETRFLRCLTVSELRPHPLCKLHHGTVNIHSLCSENKEEYSEPAAVAIQGPLVAFALRYSLCDKVVVINWRENAKPATIHLEKEFYMDQHFIADDLLVVLVCPVVDSDILRRSLDDYNCPIPRDGKLKLHIYRVGPDQNGVNSPCLVQTLLLPRFNDRWRVDIESGKILPQGSDVSSKPSKGAPTLLDGLSYRSEETAGVFCVTVSGILLKHPRNVVDGEEEDDEDEDDMGLGWVVDLVVLRSHIVSLARAAMKNKTTSPLGKEIEWKEWAGAAGEHARIFPHSDQGWLGSPKLYEACSYRVASITPLKRGDAGNEVIPVMDADAEKKKVTTADRRLDVLDFCPGRLGDVRIALEARRKRKELQDCPSDTQEAEEGMFGVVPSDLLEGEGSEITVVDAPSLVTGGPFMDDVHTSLPYVLSRFDLERGRRDDGSLPLPESVWLTEKELVLQIETEDEASEICPSFTRYTLG